MNYDLDEFNMSEEELFSRVDHNNVDSEKITAPRYSYWHSVFRVFLRKNQYSNPEHSGSCHFVHLCISVVCGI